MRVIRLGSWLVACVLRVPGLRFLYSRRRVANVDTGMHVACANTQLTYVNRKLVSRVWLKGCKVERDDVFRPAMCLLGDDSVRARVREGARAGGEIGKEREKGGGSTESEFVKHVCVYVYMYVSMHACTYACMHARMHACMLHLSIYLSISTHIAHPNVYTYMKS